MPQAPSGLVTLALVVGMVASLSNFVALVIALGRWGGKMEAARGTVLGLSRRSDDDTAAQTFSELLRVRWDEDLRERLERFERRIEKLGRDASDHHSEQQRKLGELEVKVRLLEERVDHLRKPR